MPIDWEEWQKKRQQKKSNGNGGDGDDDGGMFDFSFFKNFKFTRGNKALFFLLPVVLLIGWMASGIFVVESFEKGLVKQFGKFNRIAEQGLSYHWPYPFESVVKVNVAQITTLEVGGKAFENNSGGTNGNPDNSMMLTKDENIVDIKFVVQYRVENPTDYAFKVSQPEKTIRDAAASAMREVIGRNKIDDALTDKRIPIQEEAVKVLQAMLDKYETGFRVLTIELQEVQVPHEVRQAFRDVTSAKEDSQSFINDAQGYVNRTKPEAEGRKANILAEANSYFAHRINQAQGETSRFNALLTEYKKMPDITRARLTLETMDKVLPSNQKYLISNEAGQSILPHLGLTNVKAPAKESVSE